MKKVLIIGATGSLIPAVVEAISALDAVSVSLFARNKKRINPKYAQNYALIEGDVLDFEAVKKAIAGQDIVYVNLAGDLEKMAQNIVRAMQETGVKRIIAISSIGIYNTPLRSILVPYRKLADVIEASGLDYTIIRPDWFTDANEIDYALTQKGEPETGTAVSRKSIADFVAGIIRNPENHQNENVGLSKPH